MPPLSSMSGDEKGKSKDKGKCNDDTDSGIGKDRAREAFANVVASWWNEERTSYEESYELEDADEIPIDQLEEHNYKDLRVMNLYFSPDDSDTDSDSKDKGKNDEGKDKDEEGIVEATERAMMDAYRICLDDLVGLVGNINYWSVKNFMPFFPGDNHDMDKLRQKIGDEAATMIQTWWLNAKDKSMVGYKGKGKAKGSGNDEKDKSKDKGSGTGSSKDKGKNDEGSGDMGKGELYDISSLWKKTNDELRKLMPGKKGISKLKKEQLVELVIASKSKTSCSSD